MYFEVLTFFFVGVTIAVFSSFLVTFFLRIDLLVGVLFVGCFFAIVLIFSKKKFFAKKMAWISPDVKIMTHLQTSLFQNFFFTSLYSGYSVRTYIYGQLPYIYVKSVSTSVKKHKKIPFCASFKLINRHTSTYVLIRKWISELS